MILIIGAGISGLSVASFMRKHDYLIIEKENEPGGYCRTIKQGRFVWDYSGHFFHFRDKGIKRYIVSRMNEKDILQVVKISQIYIDNNYIDYPFQRNIHQLPKESLIDCLYDLYFKPSFDPRNLKENLLVNYGNSICEIFLFPYNEKVYCCDLSSLSKDAIGRFFPESSFKEILKNVKDPNNRSYNTYFLYPKEGAYEYVKVLLTRIDDRRLLLDETVKLIDRSKRVVRTNKRDISYDLLISTIPFPKLLHLGQMKYNNEIYTYSKVLVFNLGFDKKGLTQNHWIYFPSRELIFYRVGFYDNIYGTKQMSLYVEVGLKHNQNVDKKAIMKRVLMDLKKVNIISDHKLVSYNIVLLDPAYVHITERAKEDLQRQMTILNRYNIFSIGRYGGWKYCSIEDNIIEARELVRKIETTTR